MKGKGQDERSGKRAKDKRKGENNAEEKGER